MAAKGMAMAGAAVRSWGGRAKTDLDYCPAGPTKFAAGHPQNGKGDVLLISVLVTGCFTPLHTTPLRRAQTTYGVNVWGLIPRGAAVNSSPGYVAKGPRSANATMTKTSGVLSEAPPTRDGDPPRTRPLIGATSPSKNSPALTSPPP